MPMDRTRWQPEFLVPLRPEAGPLRGQVERALRDAARSGRLPAGTVVPSTRVLARDLGVSRGVIVDAYEQLIAEGFLVTHPAARTIVAPGVRPVSEMPVAPPQRAARCDFRPGVPDVREFPREGWSRAARRALRAVSPADLGYGDARGAVALRAALSEYLARVRGVVAVPAQIVICTGFAQGLGVAVKALAKRGIRRIALEDPAQPDLSTIVSAAGMSMVRVPVDDQGLIADRLEETGAQAVIVTPAHQFPTGSVLSPGRRRDLLGWAERRHGFVIEDDYDAEYRYDGPPVGALQGLAPERVVYAGSASKILAPALRLGWLCVPPAVVDPVTEVKKVADLGTPYFEQLVYAEFLRSGALDQHLRRMRHVYRRRRDALIGALQRRRAGVTIRGAAAGLHLVAMLPRGADERQVVRAAAHFDVRLYPLGEYWRDRPERAPQGLVLGYAHLTEEEILDGVSVGMP
jgi:GntR family transcriptional regulator / MocR family aminotransferase